MMSEKIMLKSSDGEIFEVDEATALQLTRVAKEKHVKQAVPIINVEGKILSKVIEYCKKHADADSSSHGTSKINLKKWDAEFMKVDQSTLFGIMMAAHDLNIRSLVDLTCQTVASMSRGKTTDEIRAIFDIQDDEMRPVEEEEKIRKEHPWAFE
ncbi:hypothetical protein CARUB_v10024528mg [Capsella rubella]|uniref:SKP1-like protein n=1 Tax=Capsella rubella TaxID=81985 RepID=R0FZ13_9BRAS|nr:SKP1-like protein 1A [Capsella rubella]EOA28327.1 hypothetical protein CARUB_v10024528mg [Capsella rubella]